MAYELKQDVMLQKVGSETVLLNTESGYYYSLDDIGSQMIHAYLENKSVQQVASAMAEVYDVPVATIEADIIELFDQLVTEGLATA